MISKTSPFINREEQIEKWLDAMWDTYSGDLKTTKEKSTMLYYSHPSTDATFLVLTCSRGMGKL